MSKMPLLKSLSKKPLKGVLGPRQGPRQDTKQGAGIARFLAAAIFFAALFSIAAFHADSLDYSIHAFCPLGTCVVGENATWQVSISNKGMGLIDVTKFELIDYYSTETFAYFNYTGKPPAVYSDTQGDIKINPGADVSFNISGIIPAPSEYRKLVFFPCFNLAVSKDDSVYKAQNIYDIRYCSKVNETLDVVGCIDNSTCSQDESCIGNNCLKLQCSGCSHPVGHVCTDYQCCSSSQCGFDEYCNGHACSSLKCDQTQGYSNHSCTALSCSGSQYFQNHTCEDLQCEYGEAGIGHKCQKLDCNYNEYLTAHSCESLNCSQYQGYSNHSCFNLTCSSGEAYQNHTCQRLDCFFFQDASNHKCVTKEGLILKSSVELVLLVLLGFLAFIDIEKLEDKFRRK